ncbi:N-6 DNA methylase [Williamsia muralis]|uniref:N-6 DNA methylase n=1 Tax=Williamsia marianensis TaxID=85044 RepID=A0A495IT20_WILMA|nr:N-6 DNA methylase [Williamsia muralis]RKR79820.1 N-6 DNA methylase [Williamsia muralis]
MTRAPFGGNPVDTQLLRKARGAFFTPPALADFVSRWAIQAPTDRILEPSCGEAAFLLSAAARLDQLHAPKQRRQLEGIEIHAPSARSATELVAATGRPATIGVFDFFCRAQRTPRTPQHTRGREH